MSEPTKVGEGMSARDTNEQDPVHRRPSRHSTQTTEGAVQKQEGKSWVFRENWQIPSYVRGLRA